MTKTKAWMILGVLATGCGQSKLSTILNAPERLPEKVPCAATKDTFIVCMSSNSNFANSQLKSVIQQALADLTGVVASQAFESRVAQSFKTGQGINAMLLATNYIVGMNGYCDPNSNTLARAVVGGNTIDYNECRVETDASGQPILAHVAGVLLHEISHNLGYTHPSEDPSHTSVPYFLGDLADDQLSTSGSGNASSPNGGSPSPRPGRRTRYGYGY